MSIYTDMQQLQDLNIKSKMYNSVYNILLPMFFKKKKGIYMTLNQTKLPYSDF